MMKLRLATPEHLIDINPLAGDLGYVREEGPRCASGRSDAPPRAPGVAAARAAVPIIGDAEQLIADPPVRNRGTSAARCARPTRRRTCPRCSPRSTRSP
jgi:carbon-monoxide dehydrogenase medium subunit